VLRQASQRITLAFMVGNRDFLAGPRFVHKAGMMPLHDPTVLQAFGQRVLISHGDAWCLDDAPYQAFRREVRSAAWQTRFLSQLLTERLRIAGEIRSASHQRQRFDGATHADVDAAEALRWLQLAQAAVLVHGHTHRPGTHSLGTGLVRHVLSDWDLDQAQRAEVLRFSVQGLVRMPVGVC
jgi:UDP-2,3-diacylglucosamine hydrolase